MCGIVGVASLNNDLSLSDNELHRFHNLLYCSALRGVDSAGIFLITKTGIASYKDAFHPADFIYDSRYRKWLGKQKNIVAIYGHTRAATSGKVTWANSHPFHVDNKVVLMHNGNVKQLPGYDLGKFPVDSLALATAVAEKDPKEVFEDVVGAIACVWIDIKNRSINLYRNFERPLHWAVPNNGPTMYVASEGDMLKWVIGRDLANVHPTEFQTRKIISYAYNGNGSVSKTETEVPQKKVTYYSNQSKYTEWQFGADRHGAIEYIPPTRVNKPATSLEVVKSDDVPTLKDKVEDKILYLKTIGPFTKGDRIMFTAWDLKPSPNDPERLIMKGTIVSSNDEQKDYEMNDVIYVAGKDLIKAEELFQSPLLSGKIISLVYRPTEADFDKRLSIIVNEVEGIGAPLC